jgi:hypothetical protein
VTSWGLRGYGEAGGVAGRRGGSRATGDGTSSCGVPAEGARGAAKGFRGDFEPGHPILSAASTSPVTAEAGGDFEPAVPDLAHWIPRTPDGTTRVCGPHRPSGDRFPNSPPLHDPDPKPLQHPAVRRAGPLGARAARPAPGGHLRARRSATGRQQLPALPSHRCPWTAPASSGVPAPSFADITPLGVSVPPVPRTAPALPGSLVPPRRLASWPPPHHHRPSPRTPRLPSEPPPPSAPTLAPTPHRPPGTRPHPPDPHQPNPWHRYDPWAHPRPPPTEPAPPPPPPSSAAPAPGNSSSPPRSPSLFSPGASVAS